MSREKRRRKGEPPTTAEAAAAATDEKATIERQLHVLGDEWLELRPTPIGYGVFAKRDIAAGAPLTEYYGQYITYADAQRLEREKQEQTHFRRHIASRVVIHGQRMRNGDAITDPTTQLVGCGVGAYCNDSADKKAINATFDFADSPYNVAEFVRFTNGGPYEPRAEERVTFVRATRAIATGEQICAEYGDQYWQRASVKKM